MRSAGLLIVLALLGACSRSNSAAERPTPSAPAGTLVLGERINSPLVALADIARDPRSYEGRTVATSGTVTAVCQEMGCWMELKDGSGQGHVRIHGHSFFVPKTSPGHVARVQARVVKQAAAEEDCTEKASAEAGMAKIELEATGVEID